MAPYVPNLLEEDMTKPSSSANVTPITLPANDNTVYALQCAYSEARIRNYDAYDHASMRANQLQGLLLLMTGDGLQVFDGLSEGPKHDLLWLAQQLSEEVVTMLPIIAGKDALITAKRAEE
jgi:hypothetical protein